MLEVERATPDGDRIRTQQEMSGPTGCTAALVAMTERERERATVLWYRRGQRPTEWAGRRVAQRVGPFNDDQGRPGGPPPHQWPAWLWLSRYGAGE